MPFAEPPRVSSAQSAFVYTGRVEEDGLDRGRIVLSRYMARKLLYCQLCHRQSYHVLVAWKHALDMGLSITARCVVCDNEETSPAPPGVSEQDLIRRS